MPSSTISVLAFVLILSVSVTYILNTYQENVSSEGLPEPGVKHIFTPEADIPPSLQGNKAGVWLAHTFLSGYV